MKHQRPLPRPERDVLAAILAYLGTAPGVVAWRTNTGAVTTENRAGVKRHVRFGFAGLSDIIGWRQYDDVDGGASPCPGCLAQDHIARFLAIEVKRPGQGPTRAQAAFLHLVRASGGIGLVATSVEDVVRALREGRRR